MDLEINPLLLFVPLILLIFIGAPLGFVLGFVGLTFGFLAFGTRFFFVLPGRLFGIQTSYILVALPMFIFMGNILERSGCTENLFRALHVAMGNIKGGLAYATIIICTMFAAATGVVGASVTTMGLIALPAMVQFGYDKKLAVGVVMAAGCLGILIPPSIMLVIYGSWAEISVGRLYMACVFPGLVLAGVNCLYVFFLTLRHPEYAPVVPPEERAGIPKSKIIGDVAKYTVPPVALIVLVLGGIFAGLFTPTEASGVGAFGGCIIAIANKKFNMPALREAVFRTARVCGMIGLIAGSAQCFTSAFLSMGGSRAIDELLAASGLGKWGVLIVVMILLLILGMFVGWMAILMISIPVFGPVMVSFGFDKLWFAVLVCVNLQMSFLTPPYGFALFYMKGITPLVCPEVTMEIVMRSIFPWLGLVMTGLVLLCIFPDIALILQKWIYG